MDNQSFEVYDSCVDAFKCDTIREMPEGAVFAPWVELNILDGGFLYTVGNQSSPSDEHRTVIKSFQYGFSIANGVGAKFEFLSEGGDTVYNLARALNKTVNQATMDAGKTWFSFGWVSQNCDGSITKSSSEKIYLMGKTMQSNYENGFMKITFECVDVGTRVMEERIEKNFGEDGAHIPLKNAITQIFEENKPTLKVRFVKADEAMSPWGFKNIDEGVYNYWETNQQNPIEVVRTWLAEHVTSDDKGIIIQYDPTQNPPVLYFFEDPKPGPDEAPDYCSNSIGTYIVNGGNLSPVRSFSPTIDWILINKGAGGASGIGDTQKSDVKTTIEFDNDNREENDGGMNSTLPSNISRNATSPEDTAEEAIKADFANTRAVKDYETKPGIEADLKIVGNPNFSHPISFVGKSVSIIVIDPFHLENCTWISQPICNQVLTNKNWLVLGVDHQISEGNFETTLKVKLPVPNSDINRGEPLGGPGAGMFIPDNIWGEPGPSGGA